MKLVWLTAAVPLGHHRVDLGQELHVPLQPQVSSLRELWFFSLPRVALLSVLGQLWFFSLPRVALLLCS